MRTYSPVEREIAGTRFRVLPLGVMDQTALIFELNELLSSGMKEAFGMEFGDVLRSEIDPSYELLDKAQKADLASTAIFTKLPQSFFTFMSTLDTAQTTKFMEKYLSKCLIMEGSEPRNVVIDEDIDAQKLVHFKLLGWYLAVQLGPFTEWASVLIGFINSIYPDQNEKPTKDLDQT